MIIVETIAQVAFHVLHLFVGRKEWKQVVNLQLGLLQNVKSLIDSILDRAM